jgi:predicted ArsR family transcriptional regulator
MTLSLLEWTPPPSVDVDTSRNAAVRAAVTQHRQREAILAELERTHGATDEWLAHRLDISLNAVRPRRWQLVKDGLVVDSGERGETLSGAAAILWRLRREGDPLPSSAKRTAAAKLRARVARLEQVLAECARDIQLDYPAWARDIREILEDGQ